MIKQFGHKSGITFYTSSDFCNLCREMDTLLTTSFPPYHSLLAPRSNVFGLFMDLHGSLDSRVELHHRNKDPKMNLETYLRTWNQSH